MESSAKEDTRLTVAALAQALAAREPTALLVPSRILRRVIKQDRHIKGLGLNVPHRKTYTISAGDLLQLADREELGVKPADELPPTVILIGSPDPESLAVMTAEQALLKYWRLLFHARVHLTLEQQLRSGKLPPALLRQRIEQLGWTEFDEIRSVLRQENFLLPPYADEQVYVEFAAVYLDLRHFCPAFLPQYFPGLRSWAATDELLAQDLDAEELAAATRLPGAPEALDAAAHASEAPDAPPEIDEEAVTASPRSRRARERLKRKADRASDAGNCVRAAILRLKAARLAGLPAGVHVDAASRAELRRLARRLQDALQLSDGRSSDWLKSLAALLPRSARGFWTPESRLLYDIQKVCTDHERETYTVDLVEWALSLFRQPLKRRLPGQREVLMAKHLRSAARRLAAVRLTAPQRDRLAELLKEAEQRAEAQLRQRFRPLKTEIIRDVGLVPRNLPERVALQKLTEELLDRIIERGFLTMLDLRDAISRNNLKLPDLIEPRQFLWGDQLLRADRKLHTALDGVYHRAEIYLRWSQRISALAFGTNLGRFLVRYVAIPFGGAYLVLSFLQHMIGPLAKRTAGYEPLIMTPRTVVLLGLFLWGLLYQESFRRTCVNVLRNVWRGLRMVFVDLPQALWRLPWVRRLLESRFVRALGRYGLKPLVITGLTWAAFPKLLSEPRSAIESGLSVFLAANLALNSRFGRTVEEVLIDWVVRRWEYFRLRVLTAIVQAIMDFFNRVLDTIDRLLYTVDEWLRFKSGESDLTMAVKAVLGVVWFAVTYVVRFCVNLLIEPQINPVKHFPVVTVSHKILLSCIPFLTPIFVEPLVPVLGKTLANAIFLNTLFVLPGVFGFLVWELKENWRLYEANRSRLLVPIGIGHHGETMQQLLRPGFHSGTLPKLFAKLRRADRKAYWSGRHRASHKLRERLALARLGVRHFVEREFLALLAECRCWHGWRLNVGQVDLGVNHVGIELRAEESSDDSLRLLLEEQSGWLTARVAEPGWLLKLDEQQLRTAMAALAGLYKMAGVDLVGEHAAACLGPAAAEFHIEGDRLLVSPAAPSERPVEYRLRGGATLKPQVESDTDVLVSAGTRFPTLTLAKLLFSAQRITWQAWVEAWQQAEQGRPDPGPLLGEVRLLPQWDPSECRS